MDGATYIALQRFWCAQPQDARAKILAFVHLAGSTGVSSADLRVSETGVMRLILRASGRAEDDAMELAMDALA